MASIPLSDDERQHVTGVLQTGDFVDEAAYLHSLIALDIERTRELAAAIQKGLDSGISDLTIPEILEAAKRRFHARQD